MASPTQHHPLRQNPRVEWENGLLKLIDQRILPGKFEHLYLDRFLKFDFSLAPPHKLAYYADQFQ